jgi:hypothetical protein
MRAHINSKTQKKIIRFSEQINKKNYSRDHKRRVSALEIIIQRKMRVASK